jgi:hypothetical protein
MNYSTIQDQTKPSSPVSNSNGGGADRQSPHRLAASTRFHPYAKPVQQQSVQPQLAPMQMGFNPLAASNYAAALHALYASSQRLQQP